MVELGPFSKFPNRFFGSGLAAKLGPSTAFVYLALCDHANREGANTFSASARAIAADTAIAERTISDARKKLVEHGLVRCSKEPGKSFLFTLMRPSMEWMPQKDRPRTKAKPRANRLNASPDKRELFLERCAIIEYCGNEPRKEAERLANQQIRKGGKVEKTKKRSASHQGEEKFAGLRSSSSGNTCHTP